MRKNESAVNSANKGLASQNSRQNMLPKAPSLDYLQTTSVANTASALGTSRVERAGSTNSKVAIPPHRLSTVPQYKHRVPRACESCRQRKTKCSGDTPVCRQCQILNGTCLYPLTSTEKVKRQVKKLSEKVQDYENALKSLENLVDTRTADRITGLLSKHGLDAPSSHGMKLHDGLSNVPSSPSSIGSFVEIDRVGEDLNRNEKSRATGFMGKSSEVAWMQRLQREAKRHSQESSDSLEHFESKRQEHDPALHTVNYHLDEVDISVPASIEVYAVPSQQLADRLFNDYLRTVHPFFPIIHQPHFTTQYQTFFDSNVHPGDKWLAILNMIFAIGAQHAHLIRASWRGEERDHITYLTRARILSISGHDLFSHPDLQQVQVEGLVAFYLLSSGQINRAWRMSALAVRSAITLGINLKNNIPKIPNIVKEARYRVWWCLYTFEHLLGIMTGRATFILDDICTTPLPLPFQDEELSKPVAAEILNNSHLRDKCINDVMASASVRQLPLNPSRGSKTHLARNHDSSWVKSLPFSFSVYYLYYCDLALIVQEVVNRVYSTQCVMEPWARILNRIGALRVRMDLWYQSLPENFKSSEKKDDRSDLLRCRLALNLHYFSARITLGRPCLCRRDAQRGISAHISAFSRDMAEVTLQSAKLMLDLISDEPNAIGLYEISPWWCILHYIMQAATVILLKMSFWSDKVPDEERHFVVYAKKSIRWLYAMSEHSVASQRAWQLCDISFRRIAAGMGINVDDIPSTFGCQPTPTSTLTRHHYASQRFQPVSTELWDSFLDDSSYPDVPMTDPTASVVADLHLSDDLYFPYDPISGEFIRSFFPLLGEESRKMHEEG
ncbi:transcriptional regulator family: Fungal Specific TF [Penicillium sp. IBT 35674x]|nr:transcriptional regulator family: Fungal Specific TF [Penicillium sp. IBT 35674x]